MIRVSHKICTTRIALVLILTCMVFLLCGCSNKENSASQASKKSDVVDNTVPQTEAKKIAMKVSTQTEWAYVCNSIDTLKEHSQLIVKAKVLSADATVDETGTVTTQYKVAVSDVLMGNAKKEDTLVINSLGGVIEAEKYVNKQTDPKLDDLRAKIKESKEKLYVQYSIDNAWVPEVDCEYVWFLDQSSKEGQFSPVNAYQGIFKMEGKHWQRFETKDSQSNIKSMEYSQLQQMIEK